MFLQFVGLLLFCSANVLFIIFFSVLFWTATITLHFERNLGPIFKGNESLEGAGKAHFCCALVVVHPGTSTSSFQICPAMDIL